tara:strand:+ start:1151 stop:1432 length:282 start_codon:yes stop_codon:yes gene_type:complete
MNYKNRTERVHTFADVPRIEITRHRVAGLDHWDTEDRTTVQLGCDNGAISDAIVDFLAHLHGSPYRSREDIELLQRFAGAMGLDYLHEPGVSN